MQQMKRFKTCRPLPQPCSACSLKQKGCTLLSDKIDSVGNILEEDCEEDWEALTPDDWLGFMEVIRGIVGEHDCPINATPRPWRVAQQDTTSSLC